MMNNKYRQIQALDYLVEYILMRNVTVLPRYHQDMCLFVFVYFFHIHSMFQHLDE
ncbi:hypothetical protein I79_011757 [Cricetulus griseus]|uniref:Uncharacterized protein n=1 Tax=Cricetulus griseus TaxID=10029 RepID=G3HM13_CRIGR|nr:hypothetical protein I79_011757 [Cricetulus griseus]